MEDITIVMPAIALRGMSIMPGMIAHFDISRDRSLKAVEESMQAAAEAQAEGRFFLSHSVMWM